METLDRLGWAAGRSVRCYGLKIGLEVSDASLLDRLVAGLPPGARLEEIEVVDRLYGLRQGVTKLRGVRPFHLSVVDGRVIVKTLDLDEAIERLHADLRLYVAANARRRIFVHAGVVAWQGRAIVLPGRSHAGKSTLVEALVRAGATYYSDEYAVLDAQGRVRPFPKPLSLRDAEGRQRAVPVESLGGVAGRAPLPLGLVVATRFRAGARFRPRALTAGQAILELFDNTVPAQAAAARALPVLRQAALGARAIRGARGEAASTAEAILRWAER
jgi:hypothetical protein